jgi:hypothetical protein
MRMAIEEDEDEDGDWHQRYLTWKSLEGIWIRSLNKGSLEFTPTHIDALLITRGVYPTGSPDFPPADDSEEAEDQDQAPRFHVRILIPKHPQVLGESPPELPPLRPDFPTPDTTTTCDSLRVGPLIVS